MITDAVEVPDMTKGRAVMVSLMDQYLRGLLDPFVTLLEVHKLMYFMQNSGEPLKLEFAKGRYGPYSKNLRHVLRPVEGHLITGTKTAAMRPANNSIWCQARSRTRRLSLTGIPTQRDVWKR